MREEPPRKEEEKKVADPIAPVSQPEVWENDVNFNMLQLA